MPLIVHVHDRLDLEHGAHHGGGGGDPAPPLQVHQVIHGEPVADVELVRLDPVPDLLDAFSLLLKPRGQIEDKPLAQGGAQGVHGVHLPLRVLFSQFVHGDLHGAVGGGQAGGKGQRQHILPGLEQGLDALDGLPYIDGVGGGHGAGRQPAVKLLGGHVAVIRVIVVGLALHGKGQGQHLHSQRLNHLVAQVGGRVGDNDKLAHSVDSLLYYKKNI